MSKTIDDIMSKTIDMDYSLYLVNGYASSMINKLLNRAFKAQNIDITTEQLTILNSLCKKDSQSQHSLSTNTFKGKGSITRLIDALVKNEYVHRISHPNDRRTNIIKLTSKGSELVEKAKNIIEKYYRKATRGISAKEIEIMQNLAIKMHDNLLNEDNITK
ncbi:MAG: MarR family transcriptional regulator [Bacteroidales bacterium]